jgi:mono/diheme cytochrome c family protein
VTQSRPAPEGAADPAKGGRTIARTLLLLGLALALVSSFAAKIVGGGGGMPSFSGQLSEAQIQALAGYVVDEL